MEDAQAVDHTPQLGVMGTSASLPWQAGGLQNGVQRAQYVPWVKPTPALRPSPDGRTT